MSRGRNYTENELRCRLTILGTGGVGKSSLCLRFVRDLFSTDHDPTIEDRYTKKIRLDEMEDTITVSILDTPGQEEFASELDFADFLDSDAFIMVYSINSEGSYEECRRLFDKLVDASDGDKEALIDRTVICIVANKCDIDGSMVHVDPASLQSMAEEWKTGLFFQTSAKEDTQVRSMFEAVIRDIAIQRGMIRKKRCLSGVKVNAPADGLTDRTSVDAKKKSDSASENTLLKDSEDGGNNGESGGMCGQCVIL